MWENKFERAKIFSRKKLRKFSFKFTRFSTFSISFSLILWFCFSCHLELTTTLSISARMNFFQHRGAKEIHIFTRRASRNEWFNLMNFLSWKLTLPQHDFPSPSIPRLLLKISSQFFINTCFHRDMRSRFLSLSLVMHFSHHFKMSLRNYRSVKMFLFLMSLDAFVRREKHTKLIFSATTSMNDVVMRLKHVHAFTLMRLCLFTWAKDHIMNDDGDYEEKRMSFL